MSNAHSYRLSDGTSIAVLNGGKVLLSPPDYWNRLEQGSEVLLPILSSSEREHLIERLRGSAPESAEEELLLARGFADEFGRSSVVRPALPTNAPRPEFAVRCGTCDVFVEAKGLLDSSTVRTLREVAITFGKGSWFSFDSKIDDPNRFRLAVKDKMLKSNTNHANVIVMSQYSGFPVVDVVIDALREAALNPAALGVAADLQPLIVAYVAQSTVQGIWLNQDVANRWKVNDTTTRRIHDAIVRSFYPREDDVLFTHVMNHAEHIDALQKLHGTPLLDDESPPASNAEAN